MACHSRCQIAGLFATAAPVAARGIKRFPGRARFSTCRRTAKCYIRVPDPRRCSWASRVGQPRVLCLYSFLICLVLCLLPRVSLAEGDIKYFVQISDLHFSKFNSTPSQWKRFGDREGDLTLWADNVLPAIQPQALLLTGDLTDGKKEHNHGEQLASEWQAYQRVLQQVTSISGLPSDLVLDLRGNHDDFNVPQRNGPGDTFSTVSTGWKNASARVRTTRLPLSDPSQQSTPFCPVVALVGIDLAPSPGLRGPTNFMGVATDSLLHDLDAELQALSTPARGCEKPPTVVSYGHYPLGVTVRGQDLKAVLLQHHTPVYLSGHLHAEIGRRTHHLFPAPSGYLAELETAAWKDDRRFRILTVDDGIISFADYYLQTPSAPITPDWRYGIESEEDTRSVGDLFVLLTSPTDGRYSPLSGTTPADVEEVRALLLPAKVDLTNLDDAEVWMRWTADEGGVAGGERVRMARKPGEQHVYAAAAPASWKQLEAGNKIMIQVEAALPGSRAYTSTSETRPVHAHPTHLTQPFKLDQNVAERFVLALDWPSVGARIFYSLWVLLLATLLLPKAAPGWACKLRKWLAGLGPGLLHNLANAAAWPMLVLWDMESVDLLWWPQIAYAVYLIPGPWFVGRVLSTQPMGIIARGLVLVQLEGTWQLLPSPETYIMGCCLLGTIVLPLTLWTAGIAHTMLARECRRQQARQRASPLESESLVASSGTLSSEDGPTALLSAFGSLQAGCYLLVLGAVVYANYRLIQRSCYWGYGPTAAIVAPAISWVVPMHLFLLWRLYHQLPSVVQDSKQHKCE